MKRNRDRVIEGMLAKLAQLRRKGIEHERGMRAFNKRLSLSNRRMVKAVTRLENFDKKLELSNKKLEQSIKDQREFSQMQTKMNQYFLNIIRKNGHQ